MDVLWQILPEQVQKVLATLPQSQIQEIRLRTQAPVRVIVGGRQRKFDIILTATDLENMIHKAAEYAIYAVLNQMVQGFLTIRGGIRLGLAGELVLQGGQVRSIKNISSLCVRIPHAVPHCADALLPFLLALERPYQTLIIAPPGAGKTTLLRELAVQVGNFYPEMSVLVLDERGELAANYQGVNQLNVGANADVITGGTKSYGFTNGIRSLAPQVMFTDEIVTADDLSMLNRAVSSGIVVFASVHAASITELRQKPDWQAIFQQGVFERYVVLAATPRVGTIVGVFDQGGQRL